MLDGINSPPFLSASPSSVFRPRISVIITNPQINEYRLPNFGTPGSAAVDLRAFWEGNTDGMILLPGEQFCFDAGFRIHIADSTLAGVVLPRSGSGTKGLVLANGTGLIDSDYQGPLSINMLNRTRNSMTIKRGDRIAQLVIIPVVQFNWQVVNAFDRVTERGQGGYGSTGVA